jgi:hypothetical protein
MRRIYVLIILLLCTATIMTAQETPKIELFGGYSFTRASLQGEHTNLNGWNASVAYNLNKWVGIVVDGSGAYGSEQAAQPFTVIFVCPADPASCPPPFSVGASVLHHKLHTYSIGPQLSYRTDSRFTPFAHLLFGGGYTSNTQGHRTDANGSHVATLGGGFDVRLTSLLALRTQGDLLQTRFFQQPHYGFRVSTGMVFRFGKK